MVEFPPTIRIPHTQGSWLNSWIIIFFKLTMHLTPFLLPLVIYRTQPITLLHFHSYFMHYRKRVWWTVFYMNRLFQHTWFNLHMFTSNLYYFDKTVYKAKSSEILGCGRLQLGREGTRELLRVVSCNSFPLSCGQCWFWCLLLTTLGGSCDF